MTENQIIDDVLLDEKRGKEEGKRERLPCRHSIPALNARAAHVKYRTARLIATKFHWHGCMDDLTTDRSCDSQATWVIDVLDLFLDMLPMGVCTSRHWRTSGRLVQELDACTVHLNGRGVLLKQNNL